jgi:translation initiation factor IF-3
MQTQNNTQYKPRINNYIRVPQVQVIASNGDNLGTMETFKALKLAQNEGLDLVEINPKAFPPIVRIADYGKMSYEKKKQQKESKKNQKTTELKEIDIRPVTEAFDLAHKLERAKEFLADGHKVKFVCKFRGREMAHKSIGQEKLTWMLEQLKDLISTPSPISLEGKDMFIVVFPKSTK